MANTGRNINCDKCKKNINFRSQKHIYCDGECKKYWHWPNCINVSEEKYNEIVNNVEINYSCKPCKTKRQEKRNTLNLTLNVPHNIPHNNNSSAISTPTTPLIGSNITLENIYSEMKNISNTQRKIQDAISAIELTLHDYKIITDNLTQENVELRNQNAKLNERINSIEYNIDTEKQNLLKNNIIINGIDESEDENIEEIVRQIGNVLTVHIAASNIKTAMRQQTMNADNGLGKSIIVEFNDKKTRDDIIKQYKENRKLENKDRISTKKILNNTTIDRSIYISEQLTKRKQYLCKVARDMKREKRVEFVWVKDGDVYIRKYSGAPAVKIKTTQQLHNII